MTCSARSRRSTSPTRSVQVGARALEQPAVRGVADEHVVEAVDRLVAPVGARSARRAPCGACVRAAPGSRPSSPTSSRNAPTLNSAPITDASSSTLALVAGEPLDAGREQRLDRRRHLDRLGVDRELPRAVVAAADHCVVDEHADELAHEERVAVGRRGEPVDEVTAGARSCRAARPRAPRSRRESRPSSASTSATRRAGLGERRPQLAELRTREARRAARARRAPTRRGARAGRAASAPPTGCRRSRRRADARPRATRPVRRIAQNVSSTERAGAVADHAREHVDDALAVGVVVGEQRADAIAGARAGASVSTSSSPAASRISSAIGRERGAAGPVAADLERASRRRAHRRRGASSRDRRVLPSPGEPRTVTSTAERSVARARRTRRVSRRISRSRPTNGRDGLRRARSTAATS